MTPTAARILRAVTDELAARNLEDCAGGSVSIVVKLDAAGCPKRVAVDTHVEREVSRTPLGAQTRT